MAAPPTTTIRVPKPIHKYIAELSETLEQPMGEVVARAVEMLRRQVFAQQVAEEFRHLRADPEAWAAYTNDEAVPG